MTPKRRKLTDNERADTYVLRVGYAYIDRWPCTSAKAAYLAGMRAGRKDKLRELGEKP